MSPYKITKAQYILHLQPVQAVWFWQAGWWIPTDEILPQKSNQNLQMYVNHVIFFQTKLFTTNHFLFLFCQTVVYVYKLSSSSFSNLNCLMPKKSLHSSTGTFYPDCMQCFKFKIIIMPHCDNAASCKCVTCQCCSHQNYRMVRTWAIASMKMLVLCYRMVLCLFKP